MESANEKLEKKAVFSPYCGDEKLHPNGGPFIFTSWGTNRYLEKHHIIL